MALLKIMTEADWDLHMAEILHLYLDKNWSLNKVKQHMETVHHLMASYVSLGISTRT
jgi:adenylate cyclase